MDNFPDIVSVEELINSIQQVVYAIYSGNMEEAQPLLNDILGQISGHYTYMIGNSKKYEALGIQIPVDILYQHINNMQEAIKYYDLMLLTDTLMYEITDGLKYLIELVRQVSA